MDVPNGITYAAGGAAVVLMCLGGFRAYMARNAARDKAEASVDQRAADLILTATKPFQDVITRLDNIVEEERKAKSMAEDKRDIAVQSLVTFMEKSQKNQTDLSDRMRTEFTESLKRVHERVTHNETAHAQCQNELAAANRRIEALESRERDQLRLAPSPAQMAPIVVQTPMPGQTVIGAGNLPQP